MEEKYSKEEIIEFIKEREGSAEIATAKAQEERLTYYCSSKTQNPNLSNQYINDWGNAEIETNEPLLNFVKSVFKKQNYLLFSKYVRYPLPSSSIVKDRIEPNLKRVLFAEDSFINLNITANKKFDIPRFDDRLFNEYLNNHNSIWFVDFKSDKKEPKFDLIKIDSVVSIDYCEDRDKIEKIAFKAETTVNGVEIDGFVYADEYNWAFVDEDYKFITEPNPHGLGYCPANFISSGRGIVRDSIYSKVVEKLEKFCFLQTLQNMVEPNGAIPIWLRGLLNNSKPQGQDASKTDALGINQTGGMQMPTELMSQVQGGSSSGELQTGTIIDVLLVRKDDGSLDSDLIGKYLTPIYTPIEALKYLDDRLKDIKADIISQVLGDFSNSSESAKNEVQINKSVSTLEDSLRAISIQLSAVKTDIVRSMVGVKYSISDVKYCYCFYGSKFFLDTEVDLVDNLTKAINPIEQKTIIDKLCNVRNKMDLSNRQRDKLLYSLLPYIDNNAFIQAIADLKVDPITYQLQSRFNYWITQFEAIHGDVLAFAMSDGEENYNKQQIVISNILKKLIKDEDINSESVQGEQV